MVARFFSKAKTKQAVDLREQLEKLIQTQLAAREARVSRNRALSVAIKSPTPETEQPASTWTLRFSEFRIRNERQAFNTKKLSDSLIAVGPLEAFACEMANLRELRDKAKDSAEVGSVLRAKLPYSANYVGQLAAELSKDADLPTEAQETPSKMISEVTSFAEEVEDEETENDLIP